MDLLFAFSLTSCCQAGSHAWKGELLLDAPDNGGSFLAFAIFILPSTFPALEGTGSRTRAASVSGAAYLLRCNAFGTGPVLRLHKCEEAWMASFFCDCVSSLF